MESWYFADDAFILTGFYMQNQNESDVKKIEELVLLGEESAKYLRAAVLQAEFNPNKERYEVKITKDTHLSENIPYTGDTDPVEAITGQKYRKE